MKIRKIAELILSLSIVTITGTASAETLVSKANCPPPGVWTQTVFGTRVPFGTCTVAAAAALPAAPACPSAPVVDAQANSPASILVRSGATVMVSVAGSIANAQGCTLRSSEYRLHDEYGEINTVSGFAVDGDGRFAFSVPVEASRKGNDKDGRTYTVTVSASNEAGIASSAPIVSTVAHDNRDSKN